MPAPIAVCRSRSTVVRDGSWRSVIQVPPRAMKASRVAASGAAASSMQDRHAAQALRQAQLALLKSEAHADPVFWAPFVLIGNWQ